jgi:hypothetical protein
MTAEETDEAIAHIKATKGQKEKILSPSNMFNSAKDLRSLCQVIYGPTMASPKSRFLWTISAILKRSTLAQKFSSAENFLSDDLLLDRFSKQSSFAKALVMQFVLRNGHLLSDWKMSESGQHWSAPNAEVITLKSSISRALDSSFRTLSHELGHMQCTSNWTALRIERICKSNVALKAREGRHLTWRNKREMAEMGISKPMDESHILYFFAGHSKTTGHECLEEAFAESFSSIATGLHVRKSQGKICKRSREMALQGVKTKLSMAIVALLVKRILPSQGFTFGASQKARLGLRPGQKHRLHPLYAKAGGHPELRWI